MNAFEPIRMLPVSVLNLGSGKDFRHDAFNVDVDDSWGPDAVLDFSAVDLADGSVLVRTRRFGAVTLGPESFDRIVANDVLEHVPNLMKLMTTCLGLLRPGGCFEISVPYDLSFGAWQDPTHVRAFNERSWLYYTDWFWYMGWDTARFALESLQFVPSERGAELHRQGLDRDAILTTPRAIDSMSVVLRKVALTPEDRATWQHWRERRARAGTASTTSAPAGTGLAGPAVVVAAPAAMAAAPAAVPPSLTPDLSPFPGTWALHADRHCIWIVEPRNYDHHQGFEEVAIGLSRAFAERGGSAPIVRHPSAWNGRVPIVLGAHLLTPNMALILPPESILFNLEQVDRNSSWLSDHYLGLLRCHRVLDYSHPNTAALKAIGIHHVRTLPFGTVDELTRIAPSPIRDIDVLFYGSLNDRRAAILEELKRHGVVVVHLFNVYGVERDAAIARAKLVLNLHFYDAAIFESARVVFLLANQAAVVTEGRNDDPDLAPFVDGLAVCAYGDLVSECLRLLADDAARHELAMRGYAAIGRRRQADLLAACCPSA